MQACAATPPFLSCWFKSYANADSEYVRWITQDCRETEAAVPSFG